MLTSGPCPQHGRLPPVAFSGRTPGQAPRGSVEDRALVASRPAKPVEELATTETSGQP